MEKRTTDQLRYATDKFFNDQGLVNTLEFFFGGEATKKKISEGYQTYSATLEECRVKAEEDYDVDPADISVATQKLMMSKEIFEQEIFETFKEKFCEIMLPAAAFIPIKVQLMDLLENQTDENLLYLVESAAEDITDYMTNRLENIARILHEGLPLELAEEIANQAGDTEVIPVGVKVCIREFEEDDDDENGDEGDEYHECNGECGGRCDCKEKQCCESEGHCQC